MTSDLRAFAVAGAGNRANAVHIRNGRKRVGRRAVVTMKQRKQDVFQVGKIAEFPGQRPEVDTGRLGYAAFLPSAVRGSPPSPGAVESLPCPPQV